MATPTLSEDIAKITKALEAFSSGGGWATHNAPDTDTIHCEVYTPSFEKIVNKGSFGLHVADIRAAEEALIIVATLEARVFKLEQLLSRKNAVLRTASFAADSIKHAVDDAWEAQ